MARLNEPPVSTDSLETLRRKMLRQNRDLAKSNNVRALRIRELENECACMLSENLELRGRILELEAKVEDNESRRIADHALAIRDKLESQLTEWGTMLAGLGLEPPMKRHSPRIRKTINQRMSFSAHRPSPSQRRLREIARDVEELGHISETKTSPRRSMNPEQIQALRSEAVEPADSPELGPPPSSKFIDEDPVKIDSPSRAAPEKPADEKSAPAESITKVKVDAIMCLPSPEAKKTSKPPPSPQKKKEPAPVQQETRTKADAPEPVATVPIKIGSKRKFGARDDAENMPIRTVSNENENSRFGEKPSIREKAGGKSLKELANIRKESREKQSGSEKPRKPLAAKSTNDDVSSPKKNSKPPVTDEVAAAKADLVKYKASQERQKPKTKTPAPVKVEEISPPSILPPTTSTVVSELSVPVAEPALLSPSSPEPASSKDGPRGDTPPPADITSRGEMLRPSRRNRTSISYAEPNLRDKMRRPTKELCDAVAGEGKHPRRSSQYDNSITIKRESDVGDSWRRPMSAGSQSAEPEPDSIPASPLAKKGVSAQDLPSSVATERRRRPSAAMPKAVEDIKEAPSKQGRGEKDTSDVSSNSSDMGEVDIYDFASSSSQLDREEEEEDETRKPSRRQSAAARRASAMDDNDGGLSTKERVSSRRRSMMV